MLKLPQQIIPLSSLVLVFLLMGCSPSTEVTIQEESAGSHIPSGLAQMIRPTVAIESLSRAQDGDPVEIEGVVVNQAPLLQGSLYQVQDSTGMLWVASDAAPPAIDAIVQIMGRVVVEPIQVEGIDISDYYLRETTRQDLERSGKAPNVQTPDVTEPLPVRKYAGVTFESLELVLAKPVIKAKSLRRRWN
ncbi:MAG: hypothetical protein ACFBSG_04320 [Leptolyngbyaceae cyanobacterium]